MSDYLARLIERSLGSTPQIEPLIAPLHAPSDQVLSERVESSAEFEAVPAARIETAEDPSAGAAMTTQTAEDPLPRAAMTTQAAGPPPSRTGSQHHQASIPIDESPTAFPAGKKDDRSLPTQARPKTPLRQTPSTRHPVVEPIAASLARPPSPISAPVVSVQPETTEQLDRSSLPTAASVLSVQPEAIDRPSSRIATPGASVHPETLEQSDPAPSSQESIRSIRPTATASQPKSQTIVQPEIKQATAPSVPARQALSKEPPAIHVTIGRIEVRAVHPPPEPVRRRPAPASAKISLEEYLKQRNGGAR